jgi:hypothetical protein
VFGVLHFLAFCLNVPPIGIRNCECELFVDLCHSAWSIELFATKSFISKRDVSRPAVCRFSLKFVLKSILQCEFSEHSGALLIIAMSSLEAIFHLIANVAILFLPSHHNRVR